MAKTVSKNFKLEVLGIIPTFEGKEGKLNPQEIISLSAILTFRGSSLKNILRKLRREGKDIRKKMKEILKISSLRGHASIATTPTICIAFESSKFLDSALTGLVFSSSLMASGRRTSTSVGDIIFPERISKKEKTKKIYFQASKKLIESFNFFLKEKLPKDESSRILPYGIYGTGIMQLPLESLIAVEKEAELEREWIPEEVFFLLDKIKSQSKKLGFNWLWATRKVAPRNVYIFPDIFKNPRKRNIVRDLREREGKFFETKIVSIENLATPHLKRKLRVLKREIKKNFREFYRVKKNWHRILNLRQEIVRDYNLALRIKVLSSIPWRVWGEKKRHRTVPMISDSIYFSIERTLKIFKRYKKAIREEKFTSEIIKEIDNVFNVPKVFLNNKSHLSFYLKAALEAFLAYEKLLESGIKEREAIFLIPRAIKIDVLQDYDLYNLITGYYPLRICSTAEEYMRYISEKEVKLIKKELEKRNLKEIADLIGVKCETVGFCPEVKSCFRIRNKNREYDEKAHLEMAKELEREFQKYL
jgi:hypothetical protein